MAVGAGSVWVLGDALDRRLWRLDSRTGRMQATIALGFPPTSVAVAGGTVWITDGLHDRVVPIDIATERILPPIAVGRGASGIAAGAGAVWVANTFAGTCRGSTRRRAGWSRRSTSAACRAGSPSATARSG